MSAIQSAGGGVTPILKPERTCGECTECCRTFDLNLQIDMGSVSVGRATFSRALSLKSRAGEYCSQCKIGAGCRVYAKRPKDPCQTFKCTWLTDPQCVNATGEKVSALTEEDRPDKCGYLLVNQQVSMGDHARAFQYVRVMECVAGAASGERGMRVTQSLSGNGGVVVHVKPGGVPEKIFFPPKISDQERTDIMSMLGCR